MKPYGKKNNKSKICTCWDCGKDRKISKSRARTESKITIKKLIKDSPQEFEEIFKKSFWDILA